MGVFESCTGEEIKSGGHGRSGAATPNYKLTPEEEKKSAEIGGYLQPVAKKKRSQKAKVMIDLPLLRAGDKKFDPNSEQDKNYNYQMSYFNMIGIFNDPFLIVEDVESYLTRYNLKSSDITNEITNKHQIRLVQMVRLS